MANTLITDDKYSDDKLTLQSQMQISRKEKKLYSFLSFFFKSSSKFKHSEKKDDPQGLYISEIMDCKRQAQIIAKRSPFTRLFGK